MTTEPAEITIYNEIEARASNIKLSNGYHSDVQEIERSKMTPFTGGDWPKFSFWPTPASHRADEYNMDNHTLSIVLGYFGKTRDEPFADFAAKLKADVVCAMNRATTYDADTGVGPGVEHEPSQDLGGLVASFSVTRSETIEGTEPWCGVLVEVEIKYKSETGNPFTIER